jgi:hypothetical protein
MPPTVFAKRLLEADDEVLASHAVSSEARDALEREDLGTFLDARAKRIRKIARERFAALAEIDADDSPPIASLQIEDE